MQENQAIPALAALAHPLRLRAFRALVTAGPQGLTPGVLHASLAVPPTTLSFHLKELVSAGLLRCERAGRHLVYRAEFQVINGLMTYLTENCCEGAACEATTTAPACDC